MSARSDPRSWLARFRPLGCGQGPGVQGLYQVLQGKNRGISAFQARNGGPVGLSSCLNPQPQTPNRVGLCKLFNVFGRFLACLFACSVAQLIK